MKLILAIVLLLPCIASAGTLTVTWTNPTKWTDGTTLIGTDITQNRVEYGTCNGAAFGTKIGEASKPGASTTISFQNLPPAKYCVRAYTTAKSVESLASEVGTATIAAPADRDGDGVPDASDACPDVKGTQADGCPAKPEPPSLVTGSTSAYEARPASTTAPLALVGLAPLGAPCGPETRIINGTTYCRVPKTAVDAVVWPQNLALNELWVKAAPVTP